MPLTPSDVQFINKVFDRQIREYRSWGWMRYFVLFAGLISILTGAMEFRLSFSLVEVLNGTAQPPATDQDVGATRPVTENEMLKLYLSSQEATTQYAHFAAVMESLRVVCIGMGIFFSVLGINLIGGTFAKWNRARRDAILVTLLREKCAAELGTSSGS